jgi:hypothetical protein
MGGPDVSRCSWHVRLILVDRLLHAAAGRDMRRVIHATRAFARNADPANPTGL